MDKLNTYFLNFCLIYQTYLILLPFCLMSQLKQSLIKFQFNYSAASKEIFGTRTNYASDITDVFDR